MGPVIWLANLKESKLLYGLNIPKLCAAHSLNLAVSTASGIKPIRNCLGLIEKAYMFFNTPKRNSVLLHVIENSDDEPSTKQLKRLCATRWIQRYDSVKDFSELFPFVLSALEIISDWKDPSDLDKKVNGRYRVYNFFQCY